MLHCAVYLTTESVKSSALSLQSVDDIHGGDGLSLGMLGVGDSITNHILQEYLKNTTGLFIDEPRDSLDSTSASQTADSGLGDTLDVITQNLPVPLRASFSKSFSSFASAWHFVYDFKNWMNVKLVHREEYPYITDPK